MSYNKVLDSHIELVNCKKDFLLIAARMQINQRAGSKSAM